MRTITFLVLFTAISMQIASQQTPFQISIEPINIQGLGGLQAYAWGKHDGKWLILGGRLDGLHRRQPFAAFDVAGHNNQLIVVDPVALKKWSAPLSALPVGIREQLSSTNMEFYQDGDALYLVGGYGYSNTQNNHITYHGLVAVNVPQVIDAIIQGKSLIPYFRQITDSRFAVTGGYLNKIYDTYYLTGGQNFIGRYNPMGPDFGPGFIQEYTNAIRKFRISDDGITIRVTHLPSVVDSVHLHRRDYNVAPQIMPSGQEGLTAFSGVFQLNADLPFLNCVNIDSSGYTVNPDFSQYYNHYHCAHIPLYSASAREMHTVFFGGIAQYYESNGVLIQDDNVPFVKTIARVTRDVNGKMSEYKLPIEMPSYLGAGSEFIPADNLPEFENGVFKLDDFSNDTTLVGYIFGGISSTSDNIFFTNTGTQSSASNQIFKVKVIKNTSVGVHELNIQSTGTLQMQVYPNPSGGDFNVKFNLNHTSDVQVTVTDIAGNILDKTILTNVNQGINDYSKKIAHLRHGGTFYITLETNVERFTQKVIITP